MKRVAFLLVVGMLLAACVRTVPASRIAGTYEHRDRYAGTRMSLFPDGAFVMEHWDCKGTGMIRGRWSQEGDGVLRLSAEGDAGPASELCAVDPRLCPTIRLDQLRVRVVSDSIEMDVGGVRRLARVP